MSESAFAPEGVSVTIKGDGKDAPWIVFHGSVSANKANIIEAFGMDSERVADWTLEDVAIDAAKQFKGYATTSKVLGATPVSGSEPADQAGADAQRAAQADEPAEEENPVPGLLAKVEETTTVEELKRLWAENQAVFGGSEELTAAYKAKGKALSAK